MMAGMAGPIRTLRRWWLGRQPFPESWRGIIEKRLPFYRNYPDPLAGRFRSLLWLFAREKYFIGAGGLSIEDEHRAVISGCAARLVLFIGLQAYDRLTEIVVYPHAFKRREDGEALLGEAHDWGTVVLSWPAVLDGLRRPCDGHDTALHEFAHVLDRSSGFFDGTPPLGRRRHYRDWARIMSEHFQKLRRHGWREDKVLRFYGAENEAEFFAVATEAFFERPRLMRRLLPQLYAVLRRFYRFDPAEDPRCAGSPPPVHGDPD